ncbi:MAG: YdeI/OmpD-associated family protein [Bacteroidetes bacterium]|nr:YdeI/OmpD-associated family protein [Bacteroidota bacterium]
MKATVKHDVPIISFSSRKELASWLENNHTLETGIWIKFYKKNSGVPTVTYHEALLEALCYGWIDGQLKKFDEAAYIQKFTPRRSKSGWSKRNIGLVVQLELEGKMKPSGLKQVESAKADGRWEFAYDSPSKMTVPADFIQRLSKDKKGLEFFKTLDKTNLYSIAFRLQTAKTPEVREKRMTAMLGMMSRKEKFH